MNQLGLMETYVTTVAASPAVPNVVTLPQLKMQCRVDHSFEDDLLKQMAESAVELIERDTGLLLRPITQRMQLDSFPCGGKAVEIQRWPLTAVSSVSFVGTDGVTTTWDSGDYIADTASMPPRITPGYAESYPIVRDQPGSVRVTYSGGFQAIEDVPAVAKQMVRMLVGAWFEHRELEGTIPKQTEEAYRSLCSRISWRAP